MDEKTSENSDNSELVLLADNDPIWDLISMGEGSEDSSINHDKHICSDPHSEGNIGFQKNQTL